MKYFIFTALQFFLLLFLLLTGPIIVSSFPFNLIQIFSILFTCWALLELCLRREKESYKSASIYFIRTGPYEFIRHPIYAGILLFMASLVHGEFTLLRLLDFFLFFFLISVCIRRDERLAIDHFKSEYKEYSRKTKRLVPYVY